MLDADAEGADRYEVSRVVLHIDPERETDRAKPCVGEPFGSCEVATGERLSPSSVRRVRLIELVTFARQATCVAAGAVRLPSGGGAPGL